MFELLIQLGSITTAQRAQRLLRAQGYKASLDRIAQPSEREGCGYAVSVRCDSEAPLAILSEQGIEIRSVQRK